MWGKKKTEGFICIDQSCCRLLKLANDKKTWASLSVVNIGSTLKESLINSIKQFFKSGTKVNIVLPDKSRTVFMNFPLALDTQAIIKNLNINKKEYFYTTDDLAYALKRYDNLVNKEQNIVAISYCPKETIDNVIALIKAAGIRIGKLITASDCLLGTLQRQFNNIKNDTVNIVIQIGYSKVVFMITQGFTPLRVEVLFTGNICDLENRLINTFGIEPTEALKAIQDPSTSNYEGAANIVHTDRMELKTRLGGLISELRGTKLLSNESKIYISYPVINEPELSHSISERFDLEVIQLTGLKHNEPIASNDTINHTWLLGTDYKEIPDIYAESIAQAHKWQDTDKLLLIIILICTILPFIVIEYELSNTNKQIIDIQEKYNNILQLKEEMQKVNEEQQKYLSSISNLIEDIKYRGEFTKTIRFMIDSIPSACRLENISFNKQKLEMTISGYALNRETALQYLDKLHALKNFKKIQIFYDEEKNKNIKFQMQIQLESFL